MTVPTTAGSRVRLRLVAGATAAMAAVLVLASVFLVWRVQHGLRTELDASVQGQALSAAAAVAEAPSVSAFPVSPSLTGIGQVVDVTGRVVAASEEISGESRLFSFAGAPPGTAPRLRTLRLGPIDNAEFRVAGVAVPGASGLTVYVGVPTAEVGRSAGQLATSLALAVPVMLALLSLLAWWYVGRALVPVDRLLGELERSLTRQRQFVADAAHELRSPVAAIRAQAEAPGDTAATAVPAIRHEAARLSGLVDDLLALAKLDAAPELRRRPTDLDDLVFHEMRSLSDRPGLELDASGVEAVRVVGDPALLARAVRNVLDNAGRHAAGRVVVKLHREGDVAELVVSDDGPGVPADQRLRVLERFTRLDEARARDAGGAGLGLAIVAHVAAAHGGTVVILDNDPGARVLLRLPVATDQEVTKGNTR